MLDLPIVWLNRYVIWFNDITTVSQYNSETFRALATWVVYNSNIIDVLKP
jgi:hypothetical protein